MRYELAHETLWVKRASQKPGLQLLAAECTVKAIGSSRSPFPTQVAQSPFRPVTRLRSFQKALRVPQCWQAMSRPL